MTQHAKALIVSRALLLHQHQQTHEVDVVCHDVLALPDGGYTLGAGSVFNLAKQQEFIQIISNTPQNRIRLIPENVLINRLELVVWWTPSHQNSMLIATDHNVIRLNVHYPPLIFFAMEKSIHVAAIKSNKRPKEDTKLFFPPVMCVDEELLICTGNMTLPSKPTLDNRDDYEEFFFEGTNTHYSVKSIAGVNSEADFLNFYQSTGMNRFNTRNLVPTHFKLGSFLSTLGGH